MHTTNLRKVGGSVMLAVPPALLDILRLRPGVQVGIAIESGRLVVEPQQRPRYTLDELLASEVFGQDIDLDGIVNWLDTDSDGQGSPDGADSLGDSDRDGIPDFLDQQQLPGFRAVGSGGCDLRAGSGDAGVSLLLLGLIAGFLARLYRRNSAI